ncbi:glycosyltransferase family 2 protein [Candidatus Parcubacteria bacterium]|nr:glycosyltransferase family 2 protein [Candidatus Parcubacteria bacterium]
MDKSYLEISKASDLESPKERIIFRCLEMLPLFLSLTTLTGAFFLSWYKPVWVAIFIILFDLYWLCRVCYFSFYQISTWKKMKKHLKINWLEKLNKEPKTKNWKDIYHLIVLPFYKEDADIIRTTFRALENSNYPKDKMIVVLACEEKVRESAQETAQIIKQEFGDKFYRFLITFHPQNITGEIAGKGSNTAWALEQAKEKIIDKENIPYQNVIISSFDIDTHVFPQYFACLVWNYLSAEKPLKSSYQPIPIYNNNIWDASILSRLISLSGTFWQMVLQERQEKLATFSSHSWPFQVFIDVGYPSNLVPDDSHIFWKSYFYYNGDYRVIPLYYPVSMDALMAKTLSRTAINQYKQQLRWAWGCLEIPYVIYGFLKNKKICVRDKLCRSFNIIEGFWGWAVASLLIFFLGWLPIIIGGEKFNISLLSYNLPRLTGVIMTISMVGIIVSAVLSFSLLPSRPSHYSRWKNFSLIFQWFLLPIALIFFGAFPAIDAQVRLALGKYMGFWVTDKVRKSD